jgi:putative ABC transport system ATP-binding protein
MDTPVMEKELKKSKSETTGSSNKILVDVDDLKRSYLLGEIEVPALKGVSLKVEQGEFIAIMGPSGSGKSTFMNILGCLDSPTSGTYILDGVDVSHMTSDELAEIRNVKLGFVFQGFNLLPRTSALENVELPMLYSHHIPHNEREERAIKSLEAVGLGGRLHHVPAQLSGGEQQRVAIARALVNEPALILADEPTGNLDTKTSFEIMSIFQKMNREKGMTMIMVTHESDIARFAKRFIMVRDGRVLKDERVSDRLDAEQLIKEGNYNLNGEAKL